MDEGRASLRKWKEGGMVRDSDGDEVVMVNVVIVIVMRW